MTLDLHIYNVIKVSIGSDFKGKRYPGKEYFKNHFICIFLMASHSNKVLMRSDFSQLDIY